MQSLWQQCVKELAVILPENEIDTWIRPLQARQDDNGRLCLFAPNLFVLDWIRKNCLEKIRETLARLSSKSISLKLEVGSPSTQKNNVKQRNNGSATKPGSARGLNVEYRFDLFVEGKSNQMARAAAINVANNPTKSIFNPLFLYGGVGLGKTHLMHAIGNEALRQKPALKVTYIHAERFVTEMVSAISCGKMARFKETYRSVNVLLIDDVHMFVGKKQTQEEFFHTFNALHDTGQQIVLTSDRYPKDIEGLEDRLKSRFGWGLAQAINPPEFETRTAILKSKAEQMRYELPDDVAFFMARHLRSNVRELEGALRRVVADSRFSGESITLASTKNALKDLLSSNQRQMAIGNIKEIVAMFYHLRTSDLSSVRRTRSIVRPRQIAMALAKELTSHSLAEIGRAFGGRDHTTVLHAHRKVTELKKQDAQIEKDYSFLLRTIQR